MPQHQFGFSRRLSLSTYPGVVCSFKCFPGSGVCCCANGVSNFYDRWDLTFDIASDTVSASYYQFASNTTFNLISGVAMQSTLADFSHMTYRTTPGTFNGKFFMVDDYTFTTNVPTPGAAALAGLAALGVARRRR